MTSQPKSNVSILQAELLRQKLCKSLVAGITAVKSCGLLHDSKPVESVPGFVCGKCAETFREGDACRRHVLGHFMAEKCESQGYCINGDVSSVIASFNNNNEAEVNNNNRAETGIDLEEEDYLALYVLANKKVDKSSAGIAEEFFNADNTTTNGEDDNDDDACRESDSGNVDAVLDHKKTTNVFCFGNTSERVALMADGRTQTEMFSSKLPKFVGRPLPATVLSGSSLVELPYSLQTFKLRVRPETDDAAEHLLVDELLVYLPVRKMVRAAVCATVELTPQPLADAEVFTV